VAQALRRGAHRSSADELRAAGKQRRDKCPRQSHAAWKAARDRPDPVSLLEKSSQGRIPDLIPIRYQRMLASPFTFYRGAALNMAADLAATPVSGLSVQACGDCHLMNFGAFATPERRVVFDVNDLDETLPAPWEWDVKRLAASFAIACRNNGFREQDARESVLSCVRSYREHMAELGTMRALDVWYAQISLEDLIPTIRDRDARRRARKRLAEARERSVVEHDFPKLAETAGQWPAIKENRPLIYHMDEHGSEEFDARIEAAFTSYRATLQEDRRTLLDRYEIRDIAIKVVGVGSVGTRCAIVLLMASARDPLFLQVKEARPSVLEAFAGPSAHPHHGQRVVSGCRLMQSASDAFLGWTTGKDGRHFYVRQLRDMKIAPMVEAFSRSAMMQYAEVCGWTLARAHARSGEPAAISGYLGNSERFDTAIAKWSSAYADQNEHDHGVLMKAARDGRLEVAAATE
jgi:uncharacterized protein (DUF2252 family)